MYINKAFVFGNLTRDPELRALPSGNHVTSFSVATNRVWKDRDGGRQEGTEYHNIVVFGRQAETSAQYLRKGSSVFVEGRMQTRSWEAADGNKKYRTEIIAERVQFGPRSGSSGGASSPGEGGNNGAVSRTPKKESPDTEASIEYPEEDINPDDIPF